MNGTYILDSGFKRHSKTGAWFFAFLKRIIYFMHQYARRIWSILIPVFFVILLGMVQVLITLDGKWYQSLVLIILGIVSLICLVIAIVALTYDTKTTFREHRSRKLLRNLRGYLAGMERLKRDFMAEYNKRQLDQIVESFKSLHTEIEGYFERVIPDELTVWNKPFSDLSFGIAVKESIGKLEDIIRKYESH